MIVLGKHLACRTPEKLVEQPPGLEENIYRV